MDPKKQLHIKRLKESLNQIPALLSEGRSHYDTEFKTWHDQTKRSLIEIFGNSSSYNRDFFGVRFSAGGFTVGRPTGPSQRDRQMFNEGMKRAQKVIAAAIEEAEIEETTAPIIETPWEPPPNRPPQIIVNITNMLSQVTNVEITQLLQNLNNLGLTGEQKQVAERLARELDTEAKGQKRWPVLAKCIEGLKAVGDTVYKQVAIPLLLETLKKEMGV